MNGWEWLIILTMYLYLFQWVRGVEQEMKRELNNLRQTIEDAKRDVIAALERSGM